MLRKVHNIILVQLNFITQVFLFNKNSCLINWNPLPFYFFYFLVENVTDHHVATNLDNKLKSCCSVDYISIFESVFLNLFSSCGFMVIQKTISQQCFLCWAKRELFVYPAMFPHLPEHLASRYVMLYMHVTMVLDSNAL